MGHAATPPMVVKVRKDTVTAANDILLLPVKTMKNREIFTADRERSNYSSPIRLSV